MTRATLEVCVDSADGLAFCAQAGVDRVELCSALEIGGLTPSPGLVALAAEASVPVWAMIRPRGGDFTYDTAEVDQMCRDIAAMRAAGLAGVVIGAARDGRLDGPVLRALLAAGGGMGACLHRVVDLLEDAEAAVETAVDLGFARILSSGGARRASDGIARLAAMQARAAGRIEIMAGSGVTPETVGEIARATGLRAFHASCAEQAPEAEAVARMGFGAVRARTSLARIRAMQDALAAL